MKTIHLLILSVLSVFITDSYSQCVLPTPFAGNDTALCTPNVQLNANPPAAGNIGYWSSSSSLINFTDINNPNTTVSTTQPESCYDLVWTEEVSPTCFNRDTVNICFLDGSSLPIQPPPTQTIFHCYDSTCFQTYYLPFPPCGQPSPIIIENLLQNYLYLSGQNAFMDSLFTLCHNYYTNLYDTTYIVCVDSVPGSTVIIAPDSITVDMIGDYTFQIITERIDSLRDTICGLLPCVCVTYPCTRVYFHIHYDKPEISASSTNPTCIDPCSGQASVTVSGGYPPYSVSMGMGSGGNYYMNGLCPGIYPITVIDNMGCSNATIVAVSLPPSLILHIAHTNVTCILPGEANALVSDGVPPYSYAWSNGCISQSNTGLTAGTYTLTVTDADACTATETVSIIDEFVPPVSGFITSPNQCLNGNSFDFTNTGDTGSDIRWIWSFPNGTPATSTDENPTGISWSSPGQYTVTQITTIGTCTDTSTYTIEVYEHPSVSIVSTNVSCHNHCDGALNVQVSGGTPNYTYAWSNGQIIENPTHLCAGNYTVTITDQNGCTTLDSILLTAPLPITFQIDSLNHPSCYGYCNGSILVNASGGTAPYSYTWNNSVTSNQNENLCPGNYQAVVTDANNCTANLIIELTQPDNIVTNITGNTDLCYGVTETLTANVYGGTPPYSYRWNGILSTSIISISPANDTIYSLSVIDDNGCIADTNMVYVNVSDGVQMDLFSNVDSVCPGDPVLITVGISSGLQPYTIKDDNGNIITMPFTFYPEKDTVISLTAFDNCGSSSSGSISVAVFEAPQINFSPDKISGCVPLEVNFNNSSEGIRFLWNFGDIDQANLSLAYETSHIYVKEGTYSVSLTAISDKGCRNTKTYDNLITIYPKPFAKFTADKEVVNITNPIVLFTNYSENANTNLWMFGDNEFSNLANPQHKFPASPLGTYSVTLIVTSDKGCKDTTIKDIIVKDEYTFYVPNALTPDNDGVNDIFYVKGNGIDPTNYHLYIYDRWGEIIFETENIDEGWDGRVKDGKVGKMDVYTWQVLFYTIDGIKKEEVGTVTLIR